MTSTLPDVYTVRKTPTVLDTSLLSKVAVVDIALPVLNEQRCLAHAVNILNNYLDTLPVSTHITIVDNGSTDDTWSIAQTLSEENSRIDAVQLSERGRGRALKQVWAASPSPIVAYMDIDLSTNLNALLPLLAPLISGHSDIAIGTRLAKNSQVHRGAKRETISRTYNLIVRGSLAVHFSDAQCGFKAARKEKILPLLELVDDNGWFFDTELLVLAEKSGLRIAEIPVQWTDDPDSRVNIVDTAKKDLQGIVRVGVGLATGRINVGHLGERAEPENTTLVLQMLRFILVGIVSTVLFTALFWLGLQAVNAQVACVVALLLSTVVNTAVNRRYTFGIVGRHRAGVAQLQGLIVLLLALGLTTGSLAFVHTAAPDVGTGVETITVTAANLVATLLKFVLFRNWIFPQRRR